MVPASPVCESVSASAAHARAERDAELARLLRAAAGGNATAFEHFYDATIGYAQALARRMLPAADVDDVVADAYLQTWRTAAGFDAGRGSAVTWLLTIVRSRAIDLLRHRVASPEVAGADHPGSGEDTRPADAPGPPDLLAGVQAHSRLHAALCTLSPQERSVLCLAYYRDLTHREVSDETGLPLGTVKSLILRAQAKLRARLAEAAAPAGASNLPATP